MINPREDVEATLARRRRGGRARPASRSRPSPARAIPADAILDVAEERGADLIVVGNKGMTGAKRFLLGSVPNKVSPPRALLGADHPDDVAAAATAATGVRRAVAAAASTSPAP